MSSPSHDERLAEVLEILQQTPLGSRALALDAACRDHPELADELRQLLAVGEFVNHLAHSSDPAATVASPPRARQTPEALPRPFGNFDLQEELGRGGMGVVYKAWDRTLRRHVALKMLQLGSRAEQLDFARLQVEASLLGAQDHVNIVPLYMVGESEGQPYLCMKLIEGGSLSAILAEGPLPPRRAAQYVAAIARAVHHAHQKGIIHRDLKPANILIDAEDQPQVTDFGLAKRIEGGASLTGTGAIVGTPSYMAPEQTLGDGSNPGPAVDVYSLGAVLYELLTGRPPFLAASALETLLLVRSEEPVRPRQLNPQIDFDLEFICRKCLEKRPEHRYATALDLARDLDAFLQGEPVSARSSSLVYFVTRLFRESHHAPILENWGLLWIWHSAMVMLLCGVTTFMRFAGVESHWPFLGLWSIGLAAWGVIFWNLRRRLGPVTFVERQIAHAWAAGVAATIGVFWIEVALGLSVLVLTPILAVIAGMVFLVKAGILSGWFYVAAGLSFLAAVPMALIGPTWSPLVFGVVTAVGFLVPGVKYYRKRLQHT